MVKVYIPPTLRKFADGCDIVEVNADSVTEAIYNICTTHKSLKPHIYYQNDTLKPHVMIAVNGEQSNLEDCLKEGDIVELVFAAAGGKC